VTWRISRNTWNALAWIVGGILTVVAWHVLIRFRGGNFPIKLGGDLLPEAMGPRGLWVFAGLLAWAVTTKGLVTWMLAEGRFTRLGARWRGGPDARWVVGAALFALGASLLARSRVLHGFDLTQTEPAYRFQANLLLQGRAWAPSPRFKLFFDTPPMIGDGHWYPPHGPGWPLLLAPFLAAGVPGLAAPVLLAATMPPLFGVIRRWAGAPWARLAVVLLALSPMAVFGAATQLGVTAALFAATWSLWALVRAEEQDAPGWAHVLLGAGLGLGLAIHPWLAAGWVVPLAVAWGVHVPRTRPGPGPLAAFALPLLAATGALVALQAARTGSPWTSGWERVVQYAHENHFRFTPVGKDTALPSALHRDPGRAIALAFIGAFRAAFSAWGTPVALVPAIFAGRQRGARLLLAMALGILAAGGLGPEAGPDLFGPNRFHVLLLPAIGGIVLGLRALAEALAEGPWRVTPAAGILAVLLVVTAPWTRIEVTNLRLVAGHVRLPVDLTRKLHNAVVFVPDGQYTPWCTRQRLRNPDRYIPVNPPSLDAPVLWVNHVNLVDDKQFLEKVFPGRSGWFFDWNLSTCTARLRPLSRVKGRDAIHGMSHIRAAEPADPPPWRRDATSTSPR